NISLEAKFREHLGLTVDRFHAARDEMPGIGVEKHYSRHNRCLPMSRFRTRPAISAIVASVLSSGWPALLSGDPELPKNGGAAHGGLWRLAIWRAPRPAVRPLPPSAQAQTA